MSGNTELHCPNPACPDAIEPVVCGKSEAVAAWRRIAMDAKREPATAVA